MSRIVSSLLLLPLLVASTPLVSFTQRADTLFLEVGAKEIDATLFKPHAARFRRASGDAMDDDQSTGTGQPHTSAEHAAADI